MAHVAAGAGGVEQEFDRTPSHLGGVGTHGRQPDPAMTGNRDIVITNHRNILRNAPAAALQTVDGGYGLHIVVGDEGGGTVVGRNGRKAAAAESVLETDPPALAGVLAQVMRDEGQPAVTEAEQVIDDRFHGGSFVVIDHPQTRIGEVRPETPGPPERRDRAAPSAAASPERCRR